MRYARYTARSSFFWRSKLTPERCDKILKWVSALTDEEQGMLEDLLKDTQEQVEFDAAQQEEN